ncbi:MAG: hemerythrin domain-containing protein [Anaeromyxobacteraceae bacterium]
MSTEWTPDLTLNHDLIDPQHRGLFRLLQVAADAVELPGDALLVALNRFGEALVAHLAAEERIMVETLYPERLRHKTSHDMLVSDVLGVQQEITRAGPTPSLVEIVRTRMPEWLRYHTRMNDVPLGEFLARSNPARRDPDAVRHGPAAKPN